MKESPWRKVGCPRNLQQGPPDKLSAIFLSQDCGGPGTSALLEHDLVMLTWLVVMALLITSIEGDLEEITSLCLYFSFCFLKWVTRHLLPTLLKGTSYGNGNKCLEERGLNSFLELSKNDNSHLTPLVKSKRKICCQQHEETVSLRYQPLS